MSTVAPAAAAQRRRPSLVEPAGLVLALIPVLAALRLTAHGGGYTIDDWGIWAAVTVVAAGAALLSQPATRLSGVQRVLPFSLAGLGAWSLVSAHWAAWPQSALVEADRYLFYAAAVTLVLVALPPFTGWRRLFVGLVAAGAALPALQIAIQLWHSANAAQRFEDGRLVAGVGYGGGLAAAVAIGFWPLVVLAADRATPRLVRPFAALGAGLVLATVVPTEARASVWALVLSAFVFFALCPAPLRAAVIAAGALLPTLAVWHRLNAVFSSAGGAHVHSVGKAIVFVGVVAALVGVLQVVVDALIPWPELGRRATAIAIAVSICLLLAMGTAAGLAATGGHPYAWARHTLQRSVDQVGTESGQAASEGEAGSRFGSLDTGRYDLWKVAARGFEAQPAKGYGAGNFGYLNVRTGHPFLFPYQAHSQLLEVASTLGFPGLAMYLAAILLPLGACVWVRLSRQRGKTEKLLAAGIGGSLGYFAVHAQVDWIWQISSCALPALLLAATVVAMLPPGAERRRSAIVGCGCLAAALGVALVLILPATLAERYLERSYAEPADKALSDARRAARFDRLSGRPDLAIARAMLRTGDTAGALEAARRAAGAEPRFWVAWQVLAQAAARQGDQATARAAQEQVLRLAPRLPLELRAEVPGPSFDHY